MEKWFEIMQQRQPTMRTTANDDDDDTVDDTDHHEEFSIRQENQAFTKIYTYKTKIAKYDYKSVW